MLDGKSKDDITALRLRLRSAGYSPIPAEGKVPSLKGWQNLTNADEAEIVSWCSRRPWAFNSGIIAAKTPALDIDLLNADAVAAVVEMVRKQFGNRGEILLRTGSAPKVLIPFRTSKPFDKISVVFNAPKGVKNDKLEFLCDGQQFIAYGTHPDTKQPYTWAGGEPDTVIRAKLPAISQPEAEALIREAAKIAAGFGYVSDKPSSPRNPFEAEGEQSTRGRTDQEIFDLLQSCRDGNWHEPMRSAIATLVGRGWQKSHIKMLCAQHADGGVNDRDIDKLIDTAFDKWQPPPPPPPSPPLPRELEEVHEAFRKHFGKSFDLDALDIMLAVAASQKLNGDPVWLLIVSGSGAAKTEMVQTLAGAGAHITSTITSEGALLSGAKKKKGATGGLLRKIGSEGLLVIKDVTSLLSNNMKDNRGAVMAALREVYDGRWERNVGSEGGMTLTWTGRITTIGAVTTAWDVHHAVVALMGDRFLLVRVDSEDKDARLASGRRAMKNTGSEVEMRKELVAAVGGVLAKLQDGDIELTKAEERNC
jgi:hypothetical protein